MRISNGRDRRIRSDRDRNDLGSRHRALNRIIAEIDAGLRHGYFSFTVTCEVVDHRRRRVVLHAGRQYQFVIAAEQCKPGTGTGDSQHGGAEHDD